MTDNSFRGAKCTMLGQLNVAWNDARGLIFRWSIYIFFSALALVAPHAAHAAQTLWAKPGVSLDGHTADEAACTKQLVSDRAATASIVTGGLPGISDGLVGNAVTKALVNASLDRMNFARCMKKRGYIAARLAPKDHRNYAALTPSQRASWLGTFFASDRLLEAVTPTMPPLPEVLGELGTGAFEIVPGSVKVISGTKERGEVFLTARGRLRNTAIIRKDIRYDNGNITITAGTRLYQVVVNSAFLPLPVTYWCTTVTKIKNKNTRSTLCFANDMDGYVVQSALYNNAEVSLTPRGRPESQRLVIPIILEPVDASDSPTGDISYVFDKNGILGRTSIDGKTFDAFYPVDLFVGLKTALYIDSRIITVEFSNGVKAQYTVSTTESPSAD